MIIKNEFYQVIGEIDKIISQKPTSESIKSMFDIISKSQNYADYFFDKVSDIKWFHPLKERSYFAPENAPKPIQDKEKGYYNIPRWNVLLYLERVSQQVNEPGNEKNIKELLEIIEKVTDYRKNSKSIDNYMTWSYFVKILLNIPNDEIPERIIKLVRIWLKSEFDTNIPGSDIATKLLPKFLVRDEQEDSRKAAIIVAAITDIKFQEVNKTRRSLFHQEKEAKTIVDFHWLKESFQENAAKVGEKCGNEVIYTLANRLKIIFRAKNLPWADVKYHGKEYRIKAKVMADDKCQISVGGILNEDLQGITAENELVKRLEIKSRHLFKFKLEDCRREQAFITGVVSNFNQEERFTDFEKEFDDELENIYKNLFNDYSFIWFKSLFSNPTIFDADQMLTKILRDILLAKAKINESETRKILNKILGDKYRYPLFKRLFIFIVGSYWGKYKDLFWQFINNHGAESFFDDVNYEAELYNLLQKNRRHFDNGEKEIVKNAIAAGPTQWLPDDEIDYYKAHWKQKWYSALKTDSDFKELYDEQRKITKVKEVLSFKQHAIATATNGRPVLSPEKILEMSNKELAGYLANFKSKRLTEGESDYTLTRTLRSAVAERPEKFTRELVEYLNVGYPFISSMIAGFDDVWKDKKPIKWGQLLTFIKDYINRDNFWDDRLQVKGDVTFKSDHNTVIGAIGELIQSGVKNDDWAFDGRYNSLAKEIIFLIIDKMTVAGQKNLASNDINNYVFHSLNSAAGKIAAALIFLALRIARLEDKKATKETIGRMEAIKWKDDIKSEYEKLLNNELVESFTLLGQYLPNFYWLDKEWVGAKIEEITARGSDEFWKAFMNGYLFGGNVYNDLYALMRGNYDKALNYQFKEKDTGKRLVQHIAVGYFRELEYLKKKNSLINKLLRKWQPEQINNLISFMGKQRSYVESKAKNADDIRDKVIKSWSWVYEAHYENEEDELNNEDKKILSNLAKLIVFLPRIDEENVAWIKCSARYINEAFNLRYLVEYLDDLKEKGDDNKKTAKYLSEIILEMLKENSRPGYSGYEHDHIKSLVEFIYQWGEKGDANAIAIKYGKSGEYFLREVYGAHNK